MLAESTEPGEWEFATVISFSEPIRKTKSLTARQCVTSEEAADGMLGSFRTPPADCKRTITPTSTNSYNVEYVCSEGRSRGTWSIRYTRTSIDKELRIEVDGINERQRITSKSSGHWLGPCQPD